jgi:hypothetical protein
MRTVLHDYYAPVYSAREMVCLCCHQSLLSEIHALIGEKAFAR